MSAELSAYNSLSKEATMMNIKIERTVMIALGHIEALDNDFFIETIQGLPDHFY